MFGTGLQQKQQTVGQEWWPTCEFSVSGVVEGLHPHSLELTHCGSEEENSNVAAHFQHIWSEMQALFSKVFA